MSSYTTTQLLTIIVGATCVLMGIAVWTMLPDRHLSRPVRLWTLGCVALGTQGMLLLAMPRGLPLVWLVAVVPAMDLLSFVLRIQALRLHLGLGMRWRRTLALVAAVVAAYGLSVWQGELRPRIACYYAVFCAASALFAWHAWRIRGGMRSRSAALIAGSEAGLALALLVNALALWWPQLAGTPGSMNPSEQLLFVAATVAGIYGNVGYLGVVLDETRRAEALARDARITETAAREAAEASAAELLALLHHRDRLSAERQHMLEVLAHEIRQPLNNAGSALQATAGVLHDIGGEAADQATQRLQRARAVLGTVHSVLDNTLAAATLLADVQPLTVHEVDLELLLELVLGDLSDAQRAQVRLERLDELHSAEVEPGLMRLALRNLLLNALKHGGPGVQVLLQVAERDDPPALLLSVIDDGPGMTEAQLQAAAAEPADEAPQPPRGLGLQIARTVARRHGGRLVLAPRPPHGLVSRIELPLPA